MTQVRALDLDKNKVKAAIYHNQCLYIASGCKIFKFSVVGWQKPYNYLDTKLQTETTPFKINAMIMIGDSSLYCGQKKGCLHVLNTKTDRVL